MNAKINEVKGKIPNITNLTSTTALTAVENKTPNVSNLVKRLAITQNLVKLKRKLLIMITMNIPILQNLISLAQANLPSKRDIANFVKKTDFDDKLKTLNKKITSNKTKHLLVQNEFKKLQTFDSSLFIAKIYFNNDGAQLYLIFQPIYKTITTFPGLPDTISEWESKRFSNAKIMPPYTTSKTLSSKLEWYSY